MFKEDIYSFSLRNDLNKNTEMHKKKCGVAGGLLKLWDAGKKEKVCKAAGGRC